MALKLRKIRKRARNQGWTIEITGSGHLKWVPPKKSEDIVFSASTPSDHRALKNLLSRLKKSGLSI